ncbi:hypothetical protein DH2020_025861 [Rehmannia glutinosa]|uniref:Annexin n=1 Tax=Rehmannia glutinosa TaxID=99300 RepID=A0ABR0VYJ3_REHGL
MATIRIPEMVPSPAEDCERLNKAFKRCKACKRGIKVKEEKHNTITNNSRDSLCFTSPHHLVAVRKAIVLCLTLHLKKTSSLMSLFPLKKFSEFDRYDKEVVASNIASMEAAKLHEAIEAKKLMMMSFVRVLRHYGLWKGILESIMKVVIWCIDSQRNTLLRLFWYFWVLFEITISLYMIWTPQVIRAAIVGLGTDEESLTRAIVTRAEIDMMKTGGEYYNANKSSLDNAVIGDTSGDKDFLMTLLGANLQIYMLSCSHAQESDVKGTSSCPLSEEADLAVFIEEQSENQEWYDGKKKLQALISVQKDQSL